MGSRSPIRNGNFGGKGQSIVNYGDYHPYAAMWPFVNLLWPLVKLAVSSILTPRWAKYSKKRTCRMIGCPSCCTTNSINRTQSTNFNQRKSTHWQHSLSTYWLTPAARNVCSPDTNILTINKCTTNFHGHSFKILLTHPLPSIIYFPLHVIPLSCLGSERPHGLHVLSHAPKNIAPLLTTP